MPNGFSLLVSKYLQAVGEEAKLAKLLTLQCFISFLRPRYRTRTADTAPRHYSWI